VCDRRVRVVLAVRQCSTQLNSTQIYAITKIGLFAGNVLYAVWQQFETSCRRAAATICLRPLQVDNIFVFIRQVAPILACWLFNTSSSWPLTLWPWSGVLVTCDVSYLCADFSLPRPLYSRVRPDVRDRRQTDVRQIIA